MLKAAPRLVFFHGKESGKQVLSDSSGRRIGELVNRRLLKGTNRADWFILQVTDPPPNSFLTRISTTLSSTVSKGVSFIIPRPVRIRVCLWNPVTLQSIDLPVLELESIDCISSVMVTADPNDPECCVVLILNRKYILFCHVDNSADVVDDVDNVDDDGCWTRVEYPDNFFHTNRGCQMPFAGMYDKNTIIVRTHRLSVCYVALIRIEKPRSLVIMARRLDIPFTRVLYTRYLTLWNKSHWVTCPDKSFIIRVNFGGFRAYDEVVSVIVYQLNFKTLSWHILGTCPDAAFFVRASDQALWCPMSNTEAGNRVYIVHQSAPTNRHFLYTYHIENKTISRSCLPSQPYWMPIPREEEKAEVDHQEKDYDSANGETNNGNNGEVVSLLGIMLNADLLRSISSHLLNPVDYLNIRATNTFGRSVGSAKEWKSVLATCESISVCPWLMIPSVVDRGVSGMVDPVSGNKYYLNTCWGCDFSGISYSSNGWLLMLNDFIVDELIDGVVPRRVKLWLYNPITKHTVHLPEHDHLDIFMITCSADSPNCKVVGLSTLKPVFSFIELDRNNSAREYEWIRGEITGFEYMSVNQTNINPACVQGKYYFLIGDGGSLASFDYDNVENRFHFTCHPLKLPSTDFFEQRYVVAGYNNIVLAIYVGKDGESLRVFEFDRSKVVKEWLEVHDLRNHNIYLSTAMCLCKRAEFPGKGNKIYFPRFHHGHIVHYSMDTRKFHAGEGDSSVLSHYGSEEQLYSSWFEPGVTFNLTHSRVED